MPRSHLKLVPPRKDKWGASRAQRAHRQLAWALYITEGFTANMAVAGKYEANLARAGTSQGYSKLRSVLVRRDSPKDEIMGAKKWKLSTLELLEFALIGVSTEIGTNIGNPGWTREDWEFHIRARGEIERRIKILQTTTERIKS